MLGRSRSVIILTVFFRIFNGTKKKLRVKRKTFDETGKIQREDKDLEINVKPGMKPGSKFKFKGVGDEIDGTKQDLHFIIEEVSYEGILHVRNVG